MKVPMSRIIEIKVFRSKKHPHYGHAVATLMPCNHNQYLGPCLMDGIEKMRRVSTVRIVKIEEYEIADKEACLSCPVEDNWLGELTAPEIDVLVKSIDEDDPI